MSDCRTMSREFLREFIEMYREQPCLWQTKSKEYLDRNKKNEAYKGLVKKLDSIQPNATKNTVINKINSLRGGFRREYKKVQSSLRSGTGADDVYVPSLWYYDLLLFLRDQDTPRESTSNIILNDVDEYNVGEEGSEEGGNFAEFEKETIENSGDVQSQSEAHLENDLPSPSPSTSTTAMSDNTQASSLANTDLSTALSNKRRRTRKAPAQIVGKTDQILDVVSERLNNPVDEFALIGKNVELKLRRLPKETKIYTEKLINNLLFQAELGKITEHTRIITSEILQPVSNNNSNNMFHHMQVNSGWNQPSASNNYQSLTSVDPLSPSNSTSNYYASFNPVHDAYNTDH